MRSVFRSSTFKDCAPSGPLVVNAPVMAATALVMDTPQAEAWYLRVMMYGAIVAKEM